MYDAAFHTFGVSNTHMSKKLTLLAIESSCDDTSVAVLRDDKVLSNCVASQEAHRIYGGVVPELASRAHLENIIPTVNQACLLYTSPSPRDRG